MIKKCLYCSEKFKTDKKDKKCCSRKCSAEVKRSINRERNIRICKEYLDGMSSVELGKKYNMTPTSICRFLKEYEIDVRKNKINSRHYFLNDDFFEKIDTEEKAYWLGFIYADGYVTTDRNFIGISLASRDRAHLEKFKISVEATYPIHDYISHSKFGDTPYLRIVMTSKKMKSDLIDKGVVERKTLILEPPTKVPQNLMRHFCRGYFDGDGSFSKVSKHFNLPYSMKLCGTIEMINFFQKTFDIIGHVEKRNNDDKNNYQVTFVGTEDVFRVSNYLFKNTTIFLDRKKKRHLDILDAYSRLMEKSIRL